MDNIFYNGGCVRPCIKNFSCNTNTNTNNPASLMISGLVRSVEAREKQEVFKRVKSLEKKTNDIENQLIEIVGYDFNTISNKINCKRVSDPALLQKSNEAAIYMNLSARISILYKKVNQMAEILGITAEINKIARNFRFQEGVQRYNLIINMNYLNLRLDYIQSVINSV